MTADVEEQDETQVPRSVHIFAQRILVPVLAVVTVNHLLEGLIEHIRLPRDIPEITTEIIIEIVVSSVLAFVVQFGLATNIRALVISILTILTLQFFGSGLDNPWRASIILGTTLGLLVFTPMLELPHAYVKSRQRIRREEEEHEQLLQDEPFVTFEYGGAEITLPRHGMVWFPENFMEGAFLQIVYLALLIVSLPPFFFYGLHYLDLGYYGALALVLSCTLFFATVGIAAAYSSPKFRRFFDANAQARRQRRAFLLARPDTPAVPDPLFIEHQRTWKAFVFGLRIVVLTVTAILLLLRLFLL